MKKNLRSNNLTFENITATNFPLTTMRFLQTLDENNNAEWFDANRNRYQSDVVAPLKAFISDLETPLHALNPELDVSYKVNTTVMRINRDRRFARNAPPYRNYVKASFPMLGNKWSNDPVLGFGVFPNYFYVAFRNCGDARQPFIKRQDANLKSTPKEFQRWLDQVNEACKLVLFTGDHDDIKAGPRIPKTIQEWHTLEGPTVGRIWSSEEVAQSGSNFFTVVSSTLCHLYFLKLLAVSDNVRTDASFYFARMNQLRAA